ncbi:MAG TPA: M4 family metallopeptidase [Pseudonocardiaceae bacterium]|nr:M4 family metallopeptidase [Pseudonocardiaceae bacterium]
MAYHACRNPLHCFVPPHVLEEVTRTTADTPLRDAAIDGIAAGAASRRSRIAFRALPIMAAIPSPTGKEKRRLVYNMKDRTAPLPGSLLRQEGDDPCGDEAADEAYDGAGYTYDFYSQIFGRNSLDDNGMVVKSIVHYGQKVPNAFWDGEQMLYGDGDGTLFLRFTKSPEVIGHELTHGVIQYESNLEYHDEPGALNESFADVMALQVDQWYKGQNVSEADWWIGGEILAPKVGAKGIRTLTVDLAYENNRYLGTDPQPKHMRDKYTGDRDYGGVHINSGIPNHAFYLVATELGGRCWERAGAIWYKAMRALHPKSDFAHAAETTISIAQTDFGDGSAEHKAVKSAWHQVGVT